MPVSKHRRKGEVRPRPRQVEAPVKNPPPSPPWLPVTGASLLGVGVITILVGYFTDLAAGWPWIGQNWPLVIGFVILTAGFGLLTRWR